MESLFQFVTSLRGERRKSAPALPFALAPSPSKMAFNAKETNFASPRFTASSSSSHVMNLNEAEREVSVQIRSSRSYKDVRRDNEGDLLSLEGSEKDVFKRHDGQPADTRKDFKEEVGRKENRKENRRSSSSRFSFMELFSKSKSKLVDDEKDRVDSLSLSPPNEPVRSSSPLNSLSIRSSQIDNVSISHDPPSRFVTSPSPRPVAPEHEDIIRLEHNQEELSPSLLNSPSLEYLQGMGRPVSPPLSPSSTPHKKGRRTPRHWKSKSSKRINEDEDTLDQVALSRHSPSHSKTPRAMKSEHERVGKESKTPKSPRAKFSEISSRVKSPQKRRKTLPTIELSQLSEKDEINSHQKDDLTEAVKEKSKKKVSKKESKTPRYFTSKGHTDERKEEKKGEKSEGKFSRMLSPLSHIKSPVMSPRKKESKKLKKSKKGKDKDDIKVNQESFHRLEVENSISMDEIPFLPPLSLLPPSASQQVSLEVENEISNLNSKKGTSIPTGLKPRQHREGKKTTQISLENSRSIGETTSHQLVASTSGNLSMKGMAIAPRDPSPRLQESEILDAFDKPISRFSPSPLPIQLSARKAKSPISNAYQNPDRSKMIQSDDATISKSTNIDQPTSLFSPSAPSSVSPTPFSLDFNKDENQEDTLQKEAQKFSEFMSFLSVITSPPSQISHSLSRDTLH